MKPDKQPAGTTPPTLPAATGDSSQPQRSAPSSSTGLWTARGSSSGAATAGHRKQPTAPSLFAAPTPSPAPGGSSASTEDEDLAKMMDMWWDDILAFFNRHRASAAMMVWLGVFLFDIMDLHMPAEWLVFTFFSFSVFVQAFGMSVVFFTALTLAMTVVNVAIFYLVPFSTTSLLSTIVVCMLLVRGVHGLDTKGWAITALMSLSRLYTPWCEVLPEYLQAPIAAYCTSFGILWLAYHNSRRLERLLDPACLLLGIIPPPTPRLSIVEIGDTSAIVSWAQEPQNIGLANAAQVSLGGAGAGNTYAGQQIGASGYSGSSSITSPGPVAGSSSSGGSSDFANATALSVGGIVTIERKGLAEARVSRYEIEVNGRVVGECAHADEYTNIQGLQPSCTYQVRVWAISESRGRTPSQPVFVHTLSRREAQSRASSSQRDTSAAACAGADDDAVVDINSIRMDIDVSQRKILALEENIAELKAHSEEERNRLQKEIAGLKARRKEEENAKAVQREKIRDLEAEKRRLDKEKARLDREIQEALNRKKRALERMRDQEKQAEMYLRSAKSLEDAMERECRDHHQQQAELKGTIGAIRVEVEKAKQKLDDLASQQNELSDRLKMKRAALAAQEKRNADIDGKVRDVLQRQRQAKGDRIRIAKSTEKVQAEIDSLVPQLNEITRERQRLEMTAGSKRLSVDAASSIPVAAAHSSTYGIGGVSTSSLPGSAAPQVFNYSMGSLPTRRGDARSGGAGGSGSFGGTSHHARSSSHTSIQPGRLAHDALAAIQATSHAPLVRGSQLASSMDSSPVPARIGYSNSAPRRSADLSDLLSFWDRTNPLATSSPSVSAGAVPPSALMAHRGIVSSSAAIDSISLINASGGNGSSAGAIHVLDPEVGGIGPADVDYERHLSPVGSGRDTVGHLSRAPFWSSPGAASSLSTTTAEASALSILKDTDLAYPTPERPSQRGVGPFADLIATPADQPSSLLLSGDLLGVHRSLAPTSLVSERPYVEPIGAPIRRRQGPPSPAAATFAAPSRQTATDQRGGSPVHALYSASSPFRLPTEREISHPSSFGDSLYHKRSLWDLDVSESSAKKDSARSASASAEHP
ncbi:hypothetical protein GQ54DRAFT_285198 [Martensiomyces pterosporus]|nr:hypothetical protein GQ54DRAFT_285198 [Martensiomyces pterosporus]